MLYLINANNMAKILLA